MANRTRARHPWMEVLKSVPGQGRMNLCVLLLCLCFDRLGCGVYTASKRPAHVSWLPPGRDSNQPARPEVAPQLRSSLLGLGPPCCSVIFFFSISCTVEGLAPLLLSRGLEIKNKLFPKLLAAAQEADPCVCPWAGVKPCSHQLQEGSFCVTLMGLREACMAGVT